MTGINRAAQAVMSSLVLLSAVSPASAACWYPDEKRAAQVHQFKVMMMVGTLHCRIDHSGFDELYDDFVANNESFFDANHAVLKAHFAREAGEGARRAYDAHNTAVANTHSSEQDREWSCSRLKSQLQMAAKLSPPELLVLAEASAPAPWSGPCRRSTYVATDPYAALSPTVAPAAKPAAVAVAEVEPVDEDLVQGAPAAEAPVVAVAVEPAAPSIAEAVETPAAAPVLVAEASPQPAAALLPAAASSSDAAVQAAAPVSQAEALKAAIAALQAATAVLQVVAPPPPNP